MRNHSERYWAVLPAGGSGSRLGAAIPKQYLELAGCSMLERSVDALLAASWIERALVVVAPSDRQAERLLGSRTRVAVVPRGGATRRDSVMGGLRYLSETAGASAIDWVLVHDAARPGLSLAALERLRAAFSGSNTGGDDGLDVGRQAGGLLAIPVADTVKRDAAALDASDREPAPPRVSETVDRTGLWLAQTPQMFRLGALFAALERFPGVTDEASAMEAAGHPVRLIEGDRLNFKVTTSDDLDMMRRLLGA
jgi:2-C-methyl-D-erythritol 4-phosphate cytidylyltransferase